MATPIPDNAATFTLDDLIAHTRGSIIHRGAAISVAGVSTDSRQIRQGNAFVALCGERFDGHDHLRSASDAGASVLVVSRDVDVAGPAAIVKVDDTLEALGRLARVHRRRWEHQAQAKGWDGKVIAVTGSAGKTTTCRATAAVLDALGPGAVHTPVGNLNNAIGVPMVLLGLNARHSHAVVEIGTSSAGEIAYGAGLAEPDVGLVTLVTRAHTEGLGGIEAVAREKGALFAGVREGGACVANADDPLVVAQLARTSGARVVTFGRSPEADVRVVGVEHRGWHGQDLRIQVRGHGKALTASVPLLGDAGVFASAAALAVASAVWGDRIDWQLATAGLSALHAEPGRLRARSLGCGAILIDDTYNANPASMRDSIEVAARIAHDASRRLVLVLGEMRELGEDAAREHERVGEQLAALRPDAVIAVGGEARGFVRSASPDVFGQVVSDARHAAEVISIVVGPEDVILVKGSRGIALERVVRALESWGEQER